MADEEESAKTFSVEKQLEVLDVFKTIPKFFIGDKVTVNKFGADSLKYPNEFRPAVVVEVFEKPLIKEGGKLAHGIIAVAFSEEEVVTFAQDFRYLKLINERVE